MKTKFLGAAAALALLGVVPPNIASADPLTYTVTDLGGGIATGINNAGQIVGQQNSGATIWNGGVPTALGNAPGVGELWPKASTAPDRLLGIAPS
jgi:hypothetical protein